ncbi:uncharacterized protein LOC126677700 [Mercurialis annua]|uniref:uncharacterized protein LOC126677700 n=1 Tax=Mercurialis annua TaxID=3986 RepID=UPI00215F5538|nr:uncharacterized protein LOC126677700 [Mercurialis annua]XP_050228417.1 uncharacterized protein LOC126677700 [Mercurialis annua]XP_050228418.1 uncharacterized protein LOC126677700 [Mercurialis annua]XP_050228419.1 uncharacterized protein LOC126677700 [Mercurialis annua]XP_050228420.1 uncharacterized protein LOC126677700 [Mercurialis annua]
MDTDENQEEALRLKSIAESNYKDSHLKTALKYAKKAHKLSPNLEGLSSMLTSFKILRAGAANSDDFRDWYKVLQVEPFSHANTIKKQYKKLALVLHPDKNPFLGCEDAFKLVGEGFRVLSDKIRRKEYDMRLRIKLQDERVSISNDGDETFWTACLRCRLLHQFERKYVGNVLICPSCKQGFEAVEVVEKTENDNGVRVSERLKRKVAAYEEQKMGRVEELRSGDLRKKASSGDAQFQSRKAKGVNLEEKEGGFGEWSGERLRGGGLRKRMSTVEEVLKRSKPKKVIFADETMTLAEMLLDAKKKVLQQKAKFKEKQKDGAKNSNEKEKEKLDVLEKLSNMKSKKSEASKKSVATVLEVKDSVHKSSDLEIESWSRSRKSASWSIERHTNLSNGDLEVVDTEDLDLHDFDMDRAGNKFKKGQVWAIYDDEGLPRRYGLIDDVVSMNRFLIKLIWLDRQSNADEGAICWEKMGFRICSGRFKISRRTTINSLNIFSHVVDCEREAREVFRIFPKKGSVWALHNEMHLGAEERNVSASNKQCYEVALFLTTYSEMYGMSMAYLVKVDGFNSVFTRREIGSHAIRWLGKDDVRLLSHQIPARKLSNDEVPDLFKDCWELDPELLP